MDLEDSEKRPELRQVGLENVTKGPTGWWVWEGRCEDGVGYPLLDLDPWGVSWTLRPVSGAEYPCSWGPTPVEKVEESGEWIVRPHRDLNELKDGEL